MFFASPKKQLPKTPKNDETTRLRDSTPKTHRFQEKGREVHPQSLKRDRVVRHANAAVSTAGTARHGTEEGPRLAKPWPRTTPGKHRPLNRSFRARTPELATTHSARRLDSCRCQRGGCTRRCMRVTCRSTPARAHATSVSCLFGFSAWFAPVRARP